MVRGRCLRVFISEVAMISFHLVPSAAAASSTVRIECQYPPQMDNTTLTFILALVVAFVFLRWFVNSEEEPDFHAPSQRTQQEQQQQNNEQEDGEDAPTPAHALPRRQVTTDMIEVVQQLAPHVSEPQIRYDLLRSGSVQATVERILSEGTLPFPPGYNAATAAASSTSSSRATTSSSTGAKTEPENLLKKYGVNESSIDVEKAKKMEWSDSAEERAKTLQEKKAEMILRARKRLEAQLTNQQDLSGLTK